MFPSSTPITDRLTQAPDNLVIMTAQQLKDFALEVAVYTVNGFREDMIQKARLEADRRSELAKDEGWITGVKEMAKYYGVSVPHFNDKIRPIIKEAIKMTAERTYHMHKELANRLLLEFDQRQNTKDYEPKQSKH